MATNILNRRIIYTPVLATGGGGGGGDSAEALAFLARVAALPYTLDANHIAYYKALINGLVGDGLFATRFDALYVMATQDPVVAVLNLIDSTGTYDLTHAGGGTWTTDRGFLAAGASAYDTHFQPSTATSPKYVLNDAHVMVWSNTTGDDSLGGAMGTVPGDNVFIMPEGATTGTQYSINDGSTGRDHTTNGKGFYMLCRSSSTVRNGYYGSSGTLTNPFTTGATSTALPASTIVTGGVSGFASTDKQVAATSIGNSFNSTDANQFYQRLQIYMTAVGNV